MQMPSFPILEYLPFVRICVVSILLTSLLFTSPTDQPMIKSYSVAAVRRDETVFFLAISIRRTTSLFH